MLNNILNLEGAQKITKNEQKLINGGKAPADGGGDCGTYKNVYVSDEQQCLNYDPYYRPEYIAPNTCSLMMPPC